MCVNCVTKCLKTIFTPWKYKFQACQKFFSNWSFDLNLRLSKTYSFNTSLRNTLGLYVFESLRQETKILFEKSEFHSENFTWSLLSSVAITAIHEPSAKYFKLSCLYRRRWRKWRKIGIWEKDHQILPFLEVWRR